MGEHRPGHHFRARPLGVIEEPLEDLDPARKVTADLPKAPKVAGELKRTAPGSGRGERGDRREDLLVFSVQSVEGQFLIAKLFELRLMIFHEFSK